MKRLLAGVGLLLLASLAFFLYFYDGDKIDVGPAADLAAGAGTPTPESAAEVADRTGDAGRGEAAAADENRQPRQREDDAAVRRFQVRVLRLGTRRPVAGARVSICDFADLRARMSAGGPDLDFARRRAIHDELAQSATTGTDGLVSLPLLGKIVTIEATKDRLWARRVLHRVESEPVELLVNIDRTLHVQVVRAATGEPVPDIWVAVRRRPRPGLQQLSKGAEAIASFRHIQVSLAGHEGWYVEPACPLPEPTRVPIALEQIGERPVKLALPDTGSLAIRIQNEKGRPIDGRKLSIKLSVFKTPGRVDALGPRGLWSRPEAGADGVARVHGVGLGLYLRVNVKARGIESAHRPVVVDTLGPQRAGETVDCKVLWHSADDPTGTYPIVTGRFVRRDGRPWSKAELSVWPRIFPRSSGYVATPPLQVDDAGGFRLVLRHAWPPGGTRVYRLSTKGDVRLKCRLDLSRELPPGVTDLGDILFDRGQLLVAGKVVDHEGKPIAGARIRLGQKAATKVTMGSGYPTFDCAGSHQSSKDGSFELLNIPGQELPRRELQLYVYRDGYPQSARLPVVIGARDLRVVLSAGGSLSGSVELQPGQVPEDIRITLRGKGRYWFPKVSKDGSFTQEQLEPGSLKLTAAFVSGTRAERKASSIVVDDLVIVAGQRNEDGRIQNLQVEGKVLRVTLSVLDKSENPIIDSEARVVGKGGPASGKADHRGKITLLVKELPVDVDVIAFGHRHQRVQGLREHRNVVMKRGLAVRLVTDVEPHGSDPDYHLGFFLFHVDERGRQSGLVYGRSFPYDRMYFDEKGIASLYLPGPGVYQVDPRVFVRGKDNVGRGGSLRMKPPPRFTVVESSAPQSFRIPIPANLLAATVKRYAK